MLGTDAMKLKQIAADATNRLELKLAGCFS